jgi:hypothetical protein
MTFCIAAAEPPVAGGGLFFCTRVFALCPARAARSPNKFSECVIKNGVAVSKKVYETKQLTLFGVCKSTIFFSTSAGELSHII